MIKVRVRLCLVVCEECYNLGKIDSCSVSFFLLMCIQNNTRNELARLVMGTFF